MSCSRLAVQPSPGMRPFSFPGTGRAVLVRQGLWDRAWSGGRLVPRSYRPDQAIKFLILLLSSNILSFPPDQKRLTLSILLEREPQSYQSDPHNESTSAVIMVSVELFQSRCSSDQSLAPNSFLFKGWLKCRLYSRAGLVERKAVNLLWKTQTLH